MSVSVEEARRIAVRAQLLDGTAAGVLRTVQQLGFLQIDVVSAVAPPQHLVLFSRLGRRYRRDQLDRLLWEERALVEWNAFVWPVETLPLLRPRMRNSLRGSSAWQVRTRAWLKENASFRRAVLRELEARGPLASRELQDTARTPWRSRGGWTTGKNLTVMLEDLHRLGQLAVVGRRGAERLWDLAERWWPETETVPLREAERMLADRRFRSQGVRRARDRGWEAHPEAEDGPVPDRVAVLSPFDRLVYDRGRAEALWGFRYRLEMYVPPAKREYGYYVLPILHGADLAGRIDVVHDRKERVLRVNGLWWEREPVAELDAVLDELRVWLGATGIAR
jgi:uncharacterized protein YcaQ